ncbi:hypothetical protein QU38_00455, partial [Staphylococcus aureus]
ELDRARGLDAAVRRQAPAIVRIGLQADRGERRGALLAYQRAGRVIGGLGRCEILIGDDHPPLEIVEHGIGEHRPPFALGHGVRWRGGAPARRFLEAGGHGGDARPRIRRCQIAPGEQRRGKRGHGEQGAGSD